MSKRKRKKMKKKALIMIIILMICIGIVSYLIIDSYQLKQAIKEHYHNYVKTVKETTLYDDKKNVIGIIHKNVGLILEKQEGINEYLKIKDNPYYIYYKDITKGKKQLLKENNYIPLNKNIKTSNKISLLQNNKEQIIMNKGINTPIQYEDDNNYYISFLNQIFEIPKTIEIEIVDHKNSEEENANYISVLNYDTIEQSCTSRICTTTEDFKKQIMKLKENGYYSISKEEYEKYRKGYIQLKKGAIYLTSNSKKEVLNPLEEELGIQIGQETVILTNKPTTPDNNLEIINSYQIKSYSTIDNIIKMANGEEIKELSPDDTNQGIPVLNYHFFYGEGEDCNESICLDINIFKEHLSYLKENGFKTLTMEEFTKWMYKEIELPEKSVLITVDDGAKGTGKHNGNKLIPALEEYKMHATLFLISGWWDVENYRSKYLDIQSHTYDMHQYGPCKRGQLNCATYEEALKDLKRSLEIVDNANSFCFPFYYYSDSSIKAVQDAGFKIAFVGGSRKAKRSNNKYLIPRYPIHANITMDNFKNMVN